MSRFVNAGDLAAVNPSVLSAMLLRTGWRELAGKPEVLRVLESPDSETDISIPLNPAFRDYRTRLNEALIDAEEALGDQARSFMLQLIAGPMDELFFEEHVDTVYGSVPWKLGEQLHDTAKNVFRAAAKSWDQNLPYFGTRSLGQANRFMSRVRMGQTEIDSYVVTALVPLYDQEPGGIQPLVRYEDVDNLEGGFFRGVTANLMMATAAAVYAAEEFDRMESPEPFADMVDYGLSADLLEALSKLSEKGQEAEIRAEWSPLIGEPEHVARTVEIRPDHLSAFAQAVLRFKDAPPPTKVTVRGIVTKLARAQFGQPGTSTLRVLSGAPTKTLRARLAPSQYDAAIEAHRIGDVVEVTGDLSKVGSIYWLYNVRDIEMVQRQLSLEDDPGT